MAEEKDFVIRNDFAELPPLAEEATAFLEEHDAPLPVVYAANLALEELVTNIIKYGYDDADPHEIHLRLAFAGGELLVEIVDDGHEFDPFSLPPPDTTLSIEEREIGGLGIHFVRNMLDRCEYRRIGGRNHVTLAKKL